MHKMSIACVKRFYLPFARKRASSNTLCLVCFTTNVSKRASSTKERRLAGYPF